MSHLKSKFLAAIAALVIFTVPQNAVAQSQKELVIGTFSRAIDYAPFMIAKNKGWFESVAKVHSRTIKFVEFQSLPAINESFATKRLDVAFEAEPPAIIGRAAGIDIRIVSPGVSLTQEIVVPSSSNIRVIEDLLNQTIAVPFGSSSHYGLMKILENKGIERSQMKIVDMTPQDGQSAFVAGQVQGWAIWPPFIEQQEVSGIGRTLSDADVFIQSIVVMSGHFVDSNPELVRDIVITVRKAQDWIVKNPRLSQDIVADALNMDSRVVAKAWPKHNFKPTISQREIRDIEAKIDFLKSNRFIRGSVDIEELIQLIE